MDHIGQDQHPDTVAEIGQRLGQGLAVLATLGEAAARLAAEEMRRRERREQDAERYGERLRREQERQQRAQRRRERDKAEDKPDDQLAQHAEGRRAASRDRRLIAQTLDPEWFDRADLFDLATVWRAARLREGEFPEARIAAEHVEQRLRDTYPRAMDGYDRAVAGGASRAAAMRTAAYAMAQTQPARPHRGRRSHAIDGGRPQPPVGLGGFDAAVGQERARLARGLPQAGYAEELERLGAGGVAAAQALRKILEARAGEQLRHSQAAVAVPDDPATAGVDEHTTGLDRNAGHAGEGNRDEAAARTAAQLAAEWYPDGLHQAGVLPAHLAGRQPGATRTQTQAGKPTTVRAR